MLVPFPAIVNWYDAAEELSDVLRLSELEAEHELQIVQTCAWIVRVGPKNLILSSDSWPNLTGNPVRGLIYIPRSMILSIQQLSDGQQVWLTERGVSKSPPKDTPESASKSLNPAPSTASKKRSKARSTPTDPEEATVRAGRGKSPQKNKSKRS